MLKTTKAQYKGEDVKLMCEHWKSFPPNAALLLLLPEHHGKTPEKLFSEGLIPYSDVTQYRAWLKHCGLLQMNPDVCLKCPLVRKLYLKQKTWRVSHLDGSVDKPFIPLSVLETRPRTIKV